MPILKEEGKRKEKTGRRGAANISIWEKESNRSSPFLYVKGKGREAK